MPGTFNVSVGMVAEPCQTAFASGEMRAFSFLASTGGAKRNTPSIMPSAVSSGAMRLLA